MHFQTAMKLQFWYSTVSTYPSYKVFMLYDLGVTVLSCYVGTCRLDLRLYLPLW